MIDKPPPEDDPKAWERFERAVDAALHTPPKHRKAKGSGESSPAATTLHKPHQLLKQHAPKARPESPDKPSQ